MLMKKIVVPILMSLALSSMAFAGGNNNQNGPGGDVDVNVTNFNGAGAKALAGGGTGIGGDSNAMNNSDVTFQDRLQFPNLPPATAGARSQGTECPIITEISDGKQVFVFFGSSTVGKDKSLVNGICVLYWRAKMSGATEDWQALFDYAAEADDTFKKVTKVPVLVEQTQ